MSLPPDLQRLVEPPLTESGFGEAEERVVVLRILFGGTLVECNGRVELSVAQEVVGLQHGEIGAPRVALTRAAGQLQRFVGPAERPSFDCERPQPLRFYLAGWRAPAA